MLQHYPRNTTNHQELERPCASGPGAESQSVQATGEGTKPTRGARQAPKQTSAARNRETPAQTTNPHPRLSYGAGRQHGLPRALLGSATAAAIKGPLLRPLTSPKPGGGAADTHAGLVSCQEWLETQQWRKRAGSGPQAAG